MFLNPNPDIIWSYTRHVFQGDRNQKQALRSANNHAREQARSVSSKDVPVALFAQMATAAFG
ncbi:hypothetical protein GCM10009096_03150 [Parasphingorhabdus litoris]|uniref:Transposase n=1 Tax=Parasphingorhabdus litoris TaxID=394733 RepID=A0ABP3JWI3_9SPHN